MGNYWLLKNSSVPFFVLNLYIILLLSGCMEVREIKFSPINERISQIQVSVNSSGGDIRGWSIKDREKIDSIVNFINTNFVVWYETKTSDTYILSKAAIMFITDKKYGLMLIIGDDWIGTYSKVDQYFIIRKAKISDRTAKELEEIVGINFDENRIQ